MLFDNIPIIDPERVKSIEYTGNGDTYDQELFKLGKGLDQFVVLNPVAPRSCLNSIKKIPSTDKCVVWHYNSDWIAKLFTKNWQLNNYLFVQIDVPLFWNPYLPKLKVDMKELMPPLWALDKVTAWSIDDNYSPSPDTWLVKFVPEGVNEKMAEWLWLGAITPEFVFKQNNDLPKLNFDIDYVIPWHDLAYVHTWYLDKEVGDDRVWAFKIIPSAETIGEKDMGTVEIISDYTVEHNPDLPKLIPNIDYQIPWYDFKYAHVWYLDEAIAGERVWAFKIIPSDDIVGEKDMGTIVPQFKVEQNSSLPRLEFKIDYDIPWHDLAYEHVWYLNKKINRKKIWAVKVTPSAEIKGVKEMGTIEPLIPDQLDVIFISYFEPNAEENWQRVLEKAPWAKRVDGVEGIFAAHKEAAQISETDMFYVVDGDAWLVDDFNFEFQPTLFDRDCAYVWSSINPVNGLIYQNGGVKLFNKEIILNQRTWKTLDMFTGIMPKIKSEEKVSCVAKFNVDEFSTWRSAFRESVKLYTINQMNRLNTWMTKGKSKPFGQYAIDGAKEGFNFARTNKNNLKELQKINDRKWLLDNFQQFYQKDK